MVVHSWDELIAAKNGLPDQRWVFRGEGVAGRPLVTSLERLSVGRWEHPFSELPSIEEGLLRRFKREARRYLHHVPDDEDWIAWQGLMRHYGAPTRLLDWTYSFFVALHFAIRKCQPGTHCSVWAVSVDWVQERVHGPAGILPEDGRGAVLMDRNASKSETIRKIVLREPPLPLVYFLNPFELHERLVLQQGVFMVPGDVSVPLVTNLDALGDRDAGVREIRICVSVPFLRSATKELGQMNVSDATLFPGLDGFARHLAAVIPFRELRATDGPST